VEDSGFMQRTKRYVWFIPSKSGQRAIESDTVETVDLGPSEDDFFQLRGTLRLCFCRGLAGCRPHRSIWDYETNQPARTGDLVGHL
jgi:hypothetical protein